MSEPTSIAPTPEGAEQPDVLILPAEFFFVEEVEVPAAVTPEELADYAELTMEGIAPFPLEQLRWGFLTAADGRQLLIYAAFKDRLHRAGYKNLESYIWVLPDFATLQGARFNRETVIILHGEAHHTRLQHPGGEGLPTRVEALRNDASPDASALHLRLLPVELTEKGTPVFRFETLGEAPAAGHWSPLTPCERSLWNADIRPAGYKSVERSARRTAARITRIMGYAALFAFGLILLEVLLFAGQLWLGTRVAKVEAQSTAVRRIEEKQSLMYKLEQAAQNELRPRAILEAANQIRIALGLTNSIYYDEVVIESGNRLTIEGEANTVNELNRYDEALRQSGNFELNKPLDPQTRGGKTTFTVTYDYLHSETVAPTPTNEAGTEGESKPATEREEVNE